MSLANKYRPKDFDGIIWQDHITGILKAKMQSDKWWNSNFLLFGPRWTGKTSSARILAKAINCLDPKDWNPCNQCANCEVINEWKTLDFVEIDAASHTGVENIREEIIDKAMYPPMMLKKKIYVIDEVHMLSKWAFNALLKTIEEPDATTAFILATTEVHKVPETIISRCQVFNFRKVALDIMTDHLEKICQSEWLEYQKWALDLIARLSEWCVRDAVKYVDQVSVLGKLTEEDVSKFLGIASEQTIIDFITHIKNKESDLLFGIIDDLALQWVDLQHFAKQVLAYLDANLADNVVLYLEISEKLGRVLAEIRNYPYPALVYKIIFYQGNWNVEKKAETNKQEETKDNAETTKKEEIWQENNAEAFWQNDLTKSPIWQNDNMEIKKENKESNKQEEIKENAESPLQTTKEEEVWQENNAEAFWQNDLKNPSWQNNSTNPPSWQNDQIEKNDNKEINNTDSSDLRNRVIDRIDKPSLQGSLRDKSFMSPIQDWKTTITIINMFAKTAIESHENRDYIEKILSEEHGSQVHIEVKFQSKEDYFANMIS